MEYSTVDALRAFKCIRDCNFVIKIICILYTALYTYTSAYRSVPTYIVVINVYEWCERTCTVQYNHCNSHYYWYSCVWCMYNLMRGYSIICTNTGEERERILAFLHSFFIPCAFHSLQYCCTVVARSRILQRADL